MRLSDLCLSARKAGLEIFPSFLADRETSLADSCDSSSPSASPHIGAYCAVCHTYLSVLASSSAVNVQDQFPQLRSSRRTSISFPSHTSCQLSSSSTTLKPASKQLSQHTPKQTQPSARLPRSRKKKAPSLARALRTREAPCRCRTARTAASLGHPSPPTRSTRPSSKALSRAKLSNWLPPAPSSPPKISEGPSEWQPWPVPICRSSSNSSCLSPSSRRTVAMELLLEAGARLSVLLLR